ncbi:MAG: hypothetical protein C4519_00430 [Desulfobacteraceae bacterium]|nr:MAG: hypothetical protein C4519_00430 [Desulfobacteraceae bacterium]
MIMEQMKWMQVAFDEDGQPTNGLMEYMGYGVKFYQNWLYVMDKKSWSRREAGLGSPFVTTVESGVVQYKYLLITATQGPGRGIYAAIQNINYLLPAPKPRLMVGASVYNQVKGGQDGLTVTEMNFLAEFLHSVATQGKLELNPGYIKHLRETIRILA